MSNDYALKSFSYVDKAQVSNIETTLNHYFEGVGMKVDDTNGCRVSQEDD